LVPLKPGERFEAILASCLLSALSNPYSSSYRGSCQAGQADRGGTSPEGRASVPHPHEDRGVWPAAHEPVQSIQHVPGAEPRPHPGGCRGGQRDIRPVEEHRQSSASTEDTLPEDSCKLGLLILHSRQVPLDNFKFQVLWKYYGKWSIYSWGPNAPFSIIFTKAFRFLQIYPT